MQPPSGGCVLKHLLYMIFLLYKLAATFGWLCVETLYSRLTIWKKGGSHLRVAVC